MLTLEEVIDISNQRHSQLPGLTQTVLEAVQAGSVDVDEEGLYWLAVLVSIAPTALLSRVTNQYPTLLQMLSTSVSEEDGVRDILQKRERERVFANASADIAGMMPEGVLSYADRINTGIGMS